MGFGKEPNYLCLPSEPRPHLHHFCAKLDFGNISSLRYNYLSMGEFGISNAEGATPMNAQANGPSIFTLWRAALNCPPKGLKEYKRFVFFNLSGNRTGGHQFL
jgi:hypothetical protein